MQRAPCDERVTTLLPTEQKRTLEQLAAARQCSVNAVVRLAIIEHLARQPKVYERQHDR